MTGSERRGPLEMWGGGANQIHRWKTSRESTSMKSFLICVLIVNQAKPIFTNLISVMLHLSFNQSFCEEIDFFCSDLLSFLYRGMNIDSSMFSGGNNTEFLSNPPQSHSLAAVEPALSALTAWLIKILPLYFLTLTVMYANQERSLKVS